MSVVKLDNASNDFFLKAQRKSVSAVMLKGFHALLRVSGRKTKRVDQCLLWGCLDELKGTDSCGDGIHRPVRLSAAISFLGNVACGAPQCRSPHGSSAHSKTKA